MTLKDILVKGYGIDFDSLRFDVLDKEPDATSAEDLKQSLATDEFIVNGDMDLHFDLYFDEPNGFIEIYPNKEG